jgi:hypothetical protein
VDDGFKDKQNKPNIHCTGARATWAVVFYRRYSARPVNVLFGSLAKTVCHHKRATRQNENKTKVIA